MNPKDESDTAERSPNVQPNEESAQAEMPRYKCHKEVHALKIAAIEFDAEGNAKIAQEDKGFATLTVSSYRPKFKGDENDPGYYVVYSDGYVSWSPSKAFENGYTRIP